MIQLHHGDNLAHLSAIPPESITLCYMDPPFNTGMNFYTTDKELAYEDKWTNGYDYISALTERFILIRNTLASHGSLVVHVDPRSSHYVKVALDRVFGEECFASEIIWRYRRWPTKTANFQRVHDVLLRYVRDPESKPRFNQLYEPLAASTLKTFGTGKQVAQVSAEGQRTHSVATGEPSPGVPMGDVWDIGILAPMAKERTGYPTQKPEALLERLVLSLSDAGDTVLDPYMGSGTSLAVANRLGRNAIGIDASPVAVRVARERLGI